MRVIVWGINYAPEFTGIAPHSVALCEFLSARGVDVEMVTAFAYYPILGETAGRSGRLFRTDVINGVLGPSLLAFCARAGLGPEAHLP